MARIVVVAGHLAYLVRFRGHLVRAWTAVGHEVHVATPDADPDSVEALTSMGAVHHCASLNRAGMNPFRDLADLARFARLFRRLRPDVVFAYGAKPITVGLAAAVVARVPRRYAMLAGLGYAFVRDGPRSWARALARGAQATLYRAVLHRSDRVAFHNADDRDELVRLRVAPRERTVVVNGSGVDTKWFSADRPPTSPPRFLFVGRLLRSKGVEDLIRAAPSLRSAVPEAEIHLVGAEDANPESVDRTVLRDAAARGDVVLHGQVTDVRPHLAEASVFVLPSYREGLPRSALEAMACGRTVIVSDVPGCRHVIRSGRYGTLVPARDPDALAEAMIAYARDPERIVREGAEARRTAEKEYDVRTVTAAMLHALELDGDPTVD